MVSDKLKKKKKDDFHVMPNEKQTSIHKYHCEGICLCNLILQSCTVCTRLKMRISSSLQYFCEEKLTPGFHPIKILKHLQPAATIIFQI